MATAGARPLSEAEFVDELFKRLNGDGITKSQVKQVVKAFKEEVADCLISGYKVKLTGLVSFEPRFIPEKKKGELVRNPATGETAPRKSAVPASFKGAARVSPSIKAQFPSVRTQLGRDLAVTLVGKREATKGGVK